MPKADPACRCMPLAEWPALDRAAWEDAARHSGLLDEAGLAAHWRPDTRRFVIAAYGRYLTFLDRSGWLNRAQGPGDRLTLEKLKPYITMLMGQIAPATVAGRIRGLAEALRVMVPGLSYPYLNRVRQRLKVRARPTRDKRRRMVPAQDLFQLGLSLTEQAKTGAIRREIWRASTYRDGLIIVLLSCRPLRARNLSDMILGKHLVKRGPIYHIAVPGTETKNHRDYNSVLDPLLTPLIDRYLEHYRPMLLAEAKDDGVWICWGGRRMNARILYGVIVTRTEKAFGKSICPHLFRDCAVTSLGEQNPEHVWIGMQLLHHSDPRTTEVHYDQALADHAVRQYQDSIRRARGAGSRKPPSHRQ